MQAWKQVCEKRAATSISKTKASSKVSPHVLAIGATFAAFCLPKKGGTTIQAGETEPVSVS